MMKQYHITSEMVGDSLAKRRRAVMLSSFVYFIVLLLIELFLLHDNIRYIVAPSVVAINGLAAVWSVGWCWYRLKKVASSPGFDLLVSEDSIRSVSGTVERSVREGRVRTVRETSANQFRTSGLFVSEHSKLGAFMWGGVWIPNSVPEYESVRQLALSWQRQSETDSRS